MSKNNKDHSHNPTKFAKPIFAIPSNKLAQNHALLYHSIDNHSHYQQKPNLSPSQSPSFSFSHEKYSTIPRNGLLESKPSICNLNIENQLQAANQSALGHVGTKIKFNSTFQKIIMNYDVNPETRYKRWSVNKNYENKMGEGKKMKEYNNFFAPRVKKSDYFRSHEEVVRRYHSKFEKTIKQNEEIELVKSYAALSQISHYEQLSKLKKSLIQCQRSLNSDQLALPKSESSIHQLRSCINKQKYKNCSHLGHFYRLQLAKLTIPSIDIWEH